MSSINRRDMPPARAEDREAQKERHGRSSTPTAPEPPNESPDADAHRSNGLARLAGGWSDDQVREFKRLLAPFGDIDLEMWR